MNRLGNQWIDFTWTDDALRRMLKKTFFAYN